MSLATGTQVRDAHFEQAAQHRLLFRVLSSTRELWVARIPRASPREGNSWHGPWVCEVLVPSSPIYTRQLGRRIHAPRVVADQRLILR
jgi:hypothetical protein